MVVDYSIVSSPDSDSSTAFVCSFLQIELPSQRQNRVQVKLAATHPHLLVLHGDSDAHEQQTSLST